MLHFSSYLFCKYAPPECSTFMLERYSTTELRIWLVFSRLFLQVLFVQNASCYQGNAIKKCRKQTCKQAPLLCSQRIQSPGDTSESPAEISCKQGITFRGVFLRIEEFSRKKKLFMKKLKLDFLKSFKNYDLEKFGGVVRN